MKDVVLPLRVGYLALLDNIVVEGREIQAFDLQADSGVEPPYIVIEGIFQISNNTKDSFGGEVTVDILVYNEFKGDFGGRETTDKITDEILTRVIPVPGRSGVAASGFNVYMAKLVGSNDEMNYANTGRKYRKRITIEHLVEQL
ncbi:hypothetical protein MUK70_11860 [Dyadobacter chenwenxiniae]|uniref:DUF3168 domain-containing protein n=1 Tax=Dyadobacter chenwenxiniae TaxID=2906456 RepID=A0A9X1TCC8_9BACT|nr:hypothetical protein [Dyadobacter chenwenxiniae]MCF0059937.1 hypothetical protein [Dyadobacter chenwenxiniae]UON85676.1 hypothetical protein MUK70_11860 [Dyadobacter chenwenxiniae]